MVAVIVMAAVAETACMATGKAPHLGEEGVVLVEVEGEVEMKVVVVGEIFLEEIQEMTPVIRVETQLTMGETICFGIIPC